MKWVSNYALVKEDFPAYPSNQKFDLSAVVKNEGGSVAHVFHQVLYSFVGFGVVLYNRLLHYLARKIIEECP